MHIKKILSVSLMAVCLAALVAMPGDNARATSYDIELLEPMLWQGGVTSITASDTANMGAFFKYINCMNASSCGLWPWAFGVGIGVTLLNCTYGGFQIVMSNGDQGKVDAGRNRFLWAVGGFLLLLLSGTILHFINPTGFST